MDDRELAKLLKTAGEDQNFFIGSSSTLNPDGTVTISSGGRSVRAIAQTAFCSGTWSAKRVGSTWYAWSSNAPIVNSSTLKKTRSRLSKKAESNNIILLLDSNTWADITDINTTTAKTKYKGNIDFYTGIIKQSKAYKTKRIYTFSSEGTLFGHPFYRSPSFIQNSVLLNQYVFSPLGIKVITIKDTDINQVDSVIWIPLLAADEEVYLDSSSVPYFLPLPLRFSEKGIFLLTKKARNFGMILQGEHSPWYDHNNYYLENFSKKNKSDWRFLNITYLQNWVSQCNPGKGSTIVTSATHGIPVSQLDQRMRALATFEWEGVEYAGAIAWKM